MKKLLVILFALVAIALGVIFWPEPEPEATTPKKNYLLYHEPARALAPFVLTLHDGDLFTNANVKDQWSLLFLGYTYCPDICPTTLAMLKSAYDRLQQLTPLQIVFISADPGRDSPERLNQYIHYFHNEFNGATAPHADLLPLTQNLGLAYALFDGKTPDSYLVDHSASMVFINPKGEIQATIKPMPSPYGYVPTVQSEQLVIAFRQILKRYQ